ncbi:hypothetical protein ACPV5U_19055 [Vibrio mediterranei]
MMELEELDLNDMAGYYLSDSEFWLNGEDYSGQDDHFINPQLSNPIQPIY